ncbi:protein aurora borealis [Plodia interpunctella]|uniref:protein aurora borealis n=1 Tax=Plodia interpunctella TaxID=58824 RepID=UPI0023689C90|nr:protein aurora borealis [Plodia interpunctella]
MSDENDSPKSYHKSTPPTHKKVRNPFDSALIERLHKPICSPGMCKIYKKKSNGSFRWDIDQACTLVPADIVACNSQFEPSPDPALEKIAEDATERFFSQEMVMPSPMESSKKIKPLLQISDSSIHITSFKDSNVVMKDVSAQTVLTLPPELPPEIEKILQPFCTYTQDQNISGDYEITANGSLCRKLFFEEHSDVDHYDSEQTDDEIPVEQRPPSSYEAHTPVIFSPDLSRDLVAKGMKRTFGTPLKKGKFANIKPGYRNKILDVVDFGEACLSPIEFHTPKKRIDQQSATSSSLASTSISPVTKAASSDEEKNNFTSPESEAMATCLDCIESSSDSEKKGPCFCKTPNNKSVKRSTSLKESPPRSRKGSQSFSEKRSLSMSSLHRSRSVQKLDFSMDISIDGSFHDRSQADSESSPPQDSQASWCIVEEPSIHQLVKLDSLKNHSDVQSSTKIHSINLLDDTPIKGKNKSNVLSHEISKIRAPLILSPANMSLDNSLDNSDNALCLEDKKIDFNKVDLKFLTENPSQIDCTRNAKLGGDNSVSFKRVDSGFNENTFYANASSYYESAIKPSELTVTNMSKINNSKNALKEISNIPWARIDSGFKDENSSDSVQFYTNNEFIKKGNCFRFSEAKIEDKENVATEDFGFFVPNKNDAMSMSDIFTEDMTFNCNFSSTPSKNKSRRVHS